MTHPQWRMMTSHSKPPSLVNTKFKDKDKAIVASHSDPLSPAKAKFKDKDKAKAKTKAKTLSAAKAMRLERILSNRGVASRADVAKVYAPVPASALKHLMTLALTPLLNTKYTPPRPP